MCTRKADRYLSRVVGRSGSPLPLRRDATQASAYSRKVGSRSAWAARRASSSRAFGGAHVSGASTWRRSFASHASASMRAVNVVGALTVRPSGLAYLAWKRPLGSRLMLPKIGLPVRLVAMLARLVVPDTCQI
jgi:hypothetical protein